jgi:perosamine synthetase
MQRIPVSGPWITQKEIDYVTDAVAHAWYSDANMYHERFERAFADYLGVPYVMALPSCTSAIHLALLALGVGPGDEVIVPDVTWIASAAPITYVGATPVFADIDPSTWCLSAASFEAAITPRTKAVIPVDLYGGMPDMEALEAIAKRHQIALIEDAAEAVGSTYRGRPAGSFGDVGVFSFHGSKTLTTGEGGLLATRHKTIYERALILRDHGRNPGDKMFYNTEVAYKYKMSSMQAALGLAQLERIDELVLKKRQIFEWYRAELGTMKGLTLNAAGPHVESTYWMVTILLAPALGITKDELQFQLSEMGIDTRPFFRPLSSLPAYENCAGDAEAHNRVSYQIAPFGLNLPSALNLTKESVHFVCEALRQVLGGVSEDSSSKSG